MNIQTIHSHVPFGAMLHDWLYLHQAPLNTIVHHNTIEQHYLAWETVRKQTNLYFEQGTGFEGYLVGVCDTPEAALEQTLQIGQNILAAIQRLYRFEYGFKARLMKTLLREAADPHAVQLWAAYLGAALGRLRCQIITNPRALAFQRKTYLMAGCLGPMRYFDQPDKIDQVYTLPILPERDTRRITITLEALRPDQQDAWQVAAEIGEFGHPLVREYVRQGDSHA